MIYAATWETSTKGRVFKVGTKRVWLAFHTRPVDRSDPIAPHLLDEYQRIVTIHFQVKVFGRRFGWSRNYD